MLRLPVGPLAHPLLLALPLLALTACSPDPGRQLAAVARAEDQRLAEAPELARALEARAPALRLRAARAMGRIQAPAFAPLLARRVREESDRGVRLAALFALGQLGLAEGAEPPPEAVEAVREALRDPAPEGVAGAAQALGKLAPEGAAGELSPLLSHPEAAVRAAAAYALFRLRFVPVWRRQAEEPPPLPGAAVAALIAACDDPVPEVRRAAVYAFSRYGEPRAVPALRERLADADEWTRLFAARALARSAAAEAAPDLLPVAVGDDGAHVRAEAVAALAALGAAERVPPEVADDPSFHVRAALARALGAAESEDSLALLGRLAAADESLGVRAAALEALAARQGAGARGEISAGLEHPSWLLRSAAARAAGALGDGGWPLLARAFADPDPRVRTAAVEVLGKLPGSDALLAEALASLDLAVRGTAVGAIAARESPQRLELLARAYDESPGEEWIEVREGLAEELAGVDGAAELLRRIAAGDPAPSVRRRAATALAEQGLPVPELAAAPAIEPSPFLGKAPGGNPVVVLTTDRGEIRIRCYGEEAPVHAANFLQLVGDGFYDGLIFHRVVTGFVIQGGDPRGDGWGGPGYTLRDEINPIPFTRGTVGMPKAGKDTGGGQLFITHLPTPHLDGAYTVFGQVVAGLEVVDRIEVGDRILSARVER